jgi:hypothetical protein
MVSKPQIGFKGPAKRDYISNLKKIKVCIKAYRELKAERFDRGWKPLPPFLF